MGSRGLDSPTRRKRENIKYVRLILSLWAGLQSLHSHTPSEFSVHLS